MFDFMRFSADYRVPTLSSGHHHCHEGWVQTHCPQCTDGRHGWHLGWSRERGNFNCWRCGPVRTVDVIRGLTRGTVERAKALWAQYYEGRGRKRPQGAPRHAVVRPPPMLGPLSPTHIKYLREDRGLRDIPRLAETWGLRGTGRLSDIWSWRVVSPVLNPSRENVAWVGRSIVREAKPKYRLTDDENCGEDPKSLLYGVHLVPGDAVIIVEGPGDAWKVGPGAVATMGHGWHVEQANRLRQFRRRYVMYDPDRRAQRDAHGLAEWLSLYDTEGGTTEVIDGLRGDPGSMEYREVRRLRKELRIGGES